MSIRVFTTHRILLDFSPSLPMWYTRRTLGRAFFGSDYLDRNPKRGRGEKACRK